MSRLLLRYIAQVTSVATLLAVGISDTAQGASQQEQGPKGILHVGLWVTDVDEMLAFLGEISDFTKFAESERSTGGKRIFVHDAKG